MLQTVHFANAHQNITFAMEARMGHEAKAYPKAYLNRQRAMALLRRPSILSKIFTHSKLLD
jgi:hypothetical protein